MTRVRRLFAALEPARVGVVPYRVREGTLEILLVTSRKGSRWLVPKGRIEAELGPAESALREAFEEAGVRGRLGEEPIGCYRHGAAARSPVVELYLMRVEQEVDSWPEQRARKREWLPAARARERVSSRGLGEILEEARRLLSLQPRSGLRDAPAHPALPE